MGITAENVAEKYKISREDQDAFAVESQRRAAKAIEDEKFKAEIVPVEIKDRKSTRIIDTDEHPRPETTLEKLSSLKPAFNRKRNCYGRECLRQK